GGQSGGPVGGDSAGGVEGPSMSGEPATDGADLSPETAPMRAHDAASVAGLDALITTCRACPRLVAWREQVAANPRASFRGQTYWGKAVPGFGSADARILI